MLKILGKFTLRRRRTLLFQVAVGLLAIVLAADFCAAQQPGTFTVKFTPEAHAAPFTGRVYVFFSGVGEPRRGPNWFKPDPMLAIDVKDLPPGKTCTLAISPTENADSPCLVFPEGLDPQTLSGMQAQAIIRFNPLEREVGIGPGNGFSEIVAVPPECAPLSLTVSQIARPTPTPDTEWTKVLRVPSKLLSDFHGRTMELAGVVRLPPSYATSPARRYPVVFEIPGFGGTLRMGISKSPYAPPTENGIEFLHVLLDPNCPLGHHVFADSANNGPVGTALVEEFIPALDKQFRTTAAPTGRFLTGHSSGGWSSLWLQVAWPDVFNGVWSTAPDTVDFRDFLRINLYRAGENMYVDPDGDRRPLGRVNNRAVIWYDSFTRMEDLLGPGGQLHSFEAVFSPRGDDGRPKPLWNRATGVIDTAVAEAWKPYDIRLVLEQNWRALGPKLSGKLHIFMGDKDTFYLEGATKLLKSSLEALKSDAVVEIYPDADHSTLMTRELRMRIPREMSERFLKTTQ
jgi:hypothetical protein